MLGLYGGMSVKLVDLDYADDIVLISEGTDEMRRVLDSLVRERKKVGLVINCAKAEIINMNYVNAGDCLTKGSVLRQVKRLKYLGTILSRDGS